MIRFKDRLRRRTQHQVRNHGRRLLAVLLLNTTMVGAIATAEETVHHLTNPAEMARVPAVRAVGIRMVPGSNAVTPLPSDSTNVNVNSVRGSIVDSRNDTAPDKFKISSPSDVSPIATSPASAIPVPNFAVQSIAPLPKVDAPRLPPSLPGFSNVPTVQSGSQVGIGSSAPGSKSSAPSSKTSSSTPSSGTKVSFSETNKSSGDGVSIRLIPSDSKPTKAVLPAMVIAQRDMPAESPNPAKPVVAVAATPAVGSSKSGSTTTVQNEFAIPSQRPGALAQPSVHAMVDEAASTVGANAVPSGNAASQSRQPEWIRPKPVRAISASAVVRLDESSVTRHATEPSAVTSQDSKSTQGAGPVGPAVVAAVSPTLQGPVPSVMVDIAPPTRLEERPASAKLPQVAASHSTPNSAGAPQATPSVAAVPANAATTAIAATQIADSPAADATVVGALKDHKPAPIASQSSVASSPQVDEFSMPQAIRIGGETISKVTTGPSAVAIRAAESVAATTPTPNNPSLNDPTSQPANAAVGSSPSVLKNTDIKNAGIKNNEVKVAANDPVPTATPDATSVVLNAPKVPEYPRVSAPIPLPPQTAVVAPKLPPSLSNPLPATVAPIPSTKSVAAVSTATAPTAPATSSSIAAVPPLPSSLLAGKSAPATTPAATPVTSTPVASAPAELSPSAAQVAAIPRVSSMPNALPAPSQSTPSLVSTSSNRGMVLTPAVTNRPVVTPTLPANLPNASASQLGSAKVATKPAHALPLTTANRNAVPVAVPSGNGSLVQIESQAASEILIDGNIRKIAVGDESICRALASNGRIFVVAGQLGETTIEVHTSIDSSPKLYQVQVVAPWQKANQGLSDIDQLRVAISNAVPEADIEFQSQADGSLMVRGTVGSEDQAKRVLELTRKLMLVPVLDRVDVR